MVEEMFSNGATAIILKVERQVVITFITIFMTFYAFSLHD